MMRVEMTLALLVSVLGMTTQSPYGHSEYPSHSGHSPFVRSKSVYSPSRYGQDRFTDEEMERAEGRHVRHGSDYREPLVHRPPHDYKPYSRNDRDDHKPYSRNDRDDHKPYSRSDRDDHYSQREMSSRSHHDHHDLQDDPMRNKRQAFLPYFPYFSYVPPVYQVHNIYLTPPGYHCYPARPGVPDRGPKVPEITPDPDLTSRFGGSDNGTEPAKQQPSKCVWSIVACCSPGSRDIRYACFELLGCPGAFWDVNPCDERVVAAAANSALKYYMNNQAPTTEPTFQHL